MTTTLPDPAPALDAATTLAVTVTARQAIAMGKRPTAESTVQTHLHVPGSVLRGALAGAWLTEYGEPDPRRRGRAVIPSDRRAAFIELFEGAVRFGPLLRTGSYLVPLSVRRCKYPSTPECPAFAIDHAFAESPPIRCPACDGVLAAGRGEIESADDPLVDKTRVALTEGETAQDGQLYTRRALRPRDAQGLPVTFTGHLASPRGPLPEWLSQSRRLYLGGRRSTGGGADYAADPAPLPAAGPGRDRLVLRLLSPALLVDRFGRPAGRPDEELLSELLGVRVTCGGIWTRTEVAAGWHAASNLPKPEELAVCAGSVFELRLDGVPSPDGVAALVAHGIGLRRAEGYGWVEIATGPWKPRQIIPSEQTPAPAGMAADMSATLFNSGHGKWLLNELRRFLADFEGGVRPHPYLLKRKQIESAMQDPIFERRLGALLERVQPAGIREVIEALEIRVRGAER